MNPALLELYERELRHLREMGAEFAGEYPKIAGRLSLDNIECADPYVERLLEGFAFCSARVQLKLDAAFPRFTESLLSTLYPHYLSPTPSMTVVQFQPEAAETSLADGFTLPRHTSLRGLLGEGDQTACEFRTSQDCTLWPLHISEARYYPNQAAVAAAGLSDNRKVKAAIRLSLQSDPQIPMAQVAMDQLDLYLSGEDDLPYRLFEQIFGDCVGVNVREAGYGAGSAVQHLGKNSILARGFNANESLLPSDARSFEGYRLLHEYFAFPPRFLFASVKGLAPSISRCRGDTIEVAFLLDRVDEELASVLNADHFKLHCSPAINLFPKRADRIHLRNVDHQHHVVVDRTRPVDFEVHSMTKVMGVGTKVDDSLPFSPLYSPRELASSKTHRGYFVCHRDPRVLSNRGRRLGPRSSYIGSEVFLSLVDVDEAPYAHDLKQLEVEALCTNRDLPIEMAVGRGQTDFTLGSGAPVKAIRCISGPTRPRPAPARASTHWRLISLLSLNYVSLVCEDQEHGTVGLRDLLSAYADMADPSILRQIEGLGKLTAQTVYRRLPSAGPVAFGKGTQINAHFYEEAFEGRGVFLFSAVLNQFFAHYASINSFTELTVSSETRGEISQWPSMPGLRHVL